MAPFASNRAGVRECCSSISAVSPMISGSVLEQPKQQPRQPDRLLAERRARRCARRRPSNLVEDEVDHRGDRGEPLRALHRARRLEGHVGRRACGSSPA